MHHLRPAPRFRLPERGAHEGADLAARDPARVRVLVVDDSDAFREVMRDVVVRTPGFEVVGMAASGAEALELVASLAPELVLLDRRMPEMDGIETAYRIHERHPGVVTVVLTATPDDRASAVRSLAVEDKRNLTPDWLATYWRHHGW
jgi:chemotaxis response regulator CheB